jgi:hypothetical protein
LLYDADEEFRKIRPSATDTDTTPYRYAVY